MKNAKIYPKILVALAALFALNLTSGLAFAAIACTATTAAGVANVPSTSQDSDHIYFSSHDAKFTYNAVYHIQEDLVYLAITVGQTTTAPQVSGTFLMNGVGVKPTLSFTQGATFAQLACSN